MVIRKRIGKEDVLVNKGVKLEMREIGRGKVKTKSLTALKKKYALLSQKGAE